MYPSEIFFWPLQMWGMESGGSIGLPEWQAGYLHHLLPWIPRRITSHHHPGLKRPEAQKAGHPNFHWRISAIYSNLHLFEKNHQMKISVKESGCPKPAVDQPAVAAVFLPSCPPPSSSWPKRVAHWWWSIHYSLWKKWLHIRASDQPLWKG